MLSQRRNHFLVSSARDEMRSAYAQHILNDVFEMGSHFLLCWACAKIGYSLAEHAWKLVTHWLSMRGNWLLFGWAYTEIGYSLGQHTQTFVFIGIAPCFSPVIRSPVPFSRPLSNVLCLLSQVSVPCLPSFVPCFTSLFLVSRPLFRVSLLCSLSPILCSLSHFYVLCFPPFVSHPCLTSLFLVSQFRPLFHVSLLCSLSPILCSQSHFPLFPVSRLCSLNPILCSVCDEIVEDVLRFLAKMVGGGGGPDELDLPKWCQWRPSWAKPLSLSFLGSSFERVICEGCVVHVVR